MEASATPFTGSAGSLFTMAGIFSVPAVADNVVYVGGGNHLRALLTSTGDLLWEVPTAQVVNSSPFVAGGVVYFTSVDGYLYAVE